MKKIMLCLVVCSVCVTASLNAATTGEFWGNKQEAKTAAQSTDSEKDVTMNPTSVSEAFNELTRALSSDPAGSGSQKDATTQAALAKNQVKFTKSAYASGNSGNVLYLGVEQPLGTDKKNFAVARAVRGTSSKSEVAPSIQPLAPDKVTINGEKDQDNPLVRTKTNITNLTLYNKALPVVTATADDGTGTIIPAIEVLSIPDTVSGSTILQNKNPIKDADDKEINKSIAGLAASRQEIFAAVPAMDKDFVSAAAAADDGVMRGIAVLRPAAAATDGLAIVDKATKLDVAAYELGGADAAKVQLAFFDTADNANAITRAFIGEKAAMFWDDKLQRLFIGLETRRDPVNEVNKAGGVLNLAVGRLEKKDATSATADVFKISPIVENPTKELFYDTSLASDPNKKNVVDRVVGFYFDSASTPPNSKIAYNNNVFLATDMIRSMHTTTGRDYLITAGRLSDGVTTLREVYALPLRGTSADPDGNNKQRVGTLSNADFSDAPLTFAQMPQQDVVRVGGETGSFAAGVNITDFFVVGDSVYICLAGLLPPIGLAVTQSDQVGIFQSTALFDATGIINGWTPFTRVMGSLERVFGAGLDNTTGSYLFLTETKEGEPTKPFFDPTMPNIPSDNISTVRQTVWGKTDSVNSLSAILENLFSQDRGGVHQLAVFNEKTIGFSHGAGSDHISIMVAAGLERVALIQTGKFVAGYNLFVPETAFKISDPDKNVFVFNDQALKNLGPICTASLSHFDPLVLPVPANEGWLFVGGYNGVAVLRQENGNGFDTNAGLDALTTAGYPGAGYSFLELIPTNPNNLFVGARKVACLNRVLYILTEGNLYAVDIANAAGKFDGVGTDDLNEQEIDLSSLPTDAALLDFIPLAGSAIAAVGSADFNNFRALLATTKGLFVITRNALNQHQVREVLVNNKSLGPVIQLQYLSRTSNAPSLQGNLYILAADIASTPAQGKVYRFAVNANSADIFVTPIQPNNGLIADLGDFRSNLFADGSTVLSTRGKHFGDINYLNAQPTTDSASVMPLTSLLALNELNTTVGAVVRESASGALYVPGDWGVRAHL